ncbi:AzlC family ABC transporter permease [Aggregicoccus sp. 17bor-14]|uniref:AzlC family ABC transporter permease n=1 Tax=Myxococcaceae TaxID=31 RepID=UPI00129C2FF2|nr:MULTISPECIES: AzlC family ABC transporter permease [Myxococcaceae]MBF5043074.1 AzlC family ABC transporter permease [Simulacricoccus sp. 17bor-14]MRI88837.1 AzlC family ABC transporter permease [Aggregicoccus sp. 17bor-14]
MTSSFWRGYRATLPLWLGAAPFGLAYAVTARAAGLSVRDTQLMSVLVYAGGAQFSAAGLFAERASVGALLFTTLLLNLRHVLYGLSLGRLVPFTPGERALAAHFLTDETYGVTVAEPRRDFRFVLGSGASLFTVWNVFTFLGILAGAAVPDPERLGVDFVFPLAFLALLIPMLRARTEWTVAAASGLFALALSRVAPGGLVVLLTAVGGALLGAVLSQAKRRREREARP